jgi:hypothetical protein
MRRRNFLRGAALSFLALPAWLGCAFQKGGAVDFTSPDEVVDNAVGRVFLRAQKIGKPLLVVVIPADTTQRYERGHIWGEYLNYGEIWPLALCEVICANEKEIADLAPVGGEPLFYLLESDAGSIKATTHNTKLPSSSRHGYDEVAASTIEARITGLGALVKSALAKDEAMLSTRAAFVESALGEEAVRFKASRGFKTTLAEVDRFAAIVANSTPKNLESLTSAAAERVKVKKIEGSRWTQSSGCGPDMHEDATKEEREEMGMFDCGMGFVPEKSQRFLTFYADSSAT